MKVRAKAAIPAKEMLPGSNIRSAPLVEFELEVVLFKEEEGVGCATEVVKPEDGVEVDEGAAEGPPIGAVDAALTSA